MCRKNGKYPFLQLRYLQVISAWNSQYGSFACFPLTASAAINLEFSLAYHNKIYFLFMNRTYSVWVKIDKASACCPRNSHSGYWDDGNLTILQQALQGSCCPDFYGRKSNSHPLLAFILKGYRLLVRIGHMILCYYKIGNKGQYVPYSMKITRRIQKKKRLTHIMAVRAHEGL